MYLAIDTEAGGIGLDKSLLSIGLVFTNNNKAWSLDYPWTDNYEILVKPNDGIYRCTAEALSVNKINIVDHDSKAVTYKQGGTSLYNILKLIRNVLNIKERFTVIGKGVAGDLNQIWDKVISRETWHFFCSYDTIDITTLWKTLVIIGKIDHTGNTSLSDMGKYFGLPPLESHNAVEDAKMTMRVFYKMMELLRK